MRVCTKERRRIVIKAAVLFYFILFFLELFLKLFFFCWLKLMYNFLHCRTSYYDKTLFLLQIKTIPKRNMRVFNRCENTSHTWTMRQSTTETTVMVYVWFMTEGQMSKLMLNVKYLLLLFFLTAAEFYNWGHIQGIIRVH